VDGYLNEKALTIGFARRFATYKRATLVFRDLERLDKIVNNPDRPVQFIFAGKAHPADIPGQKLIKEIFEISQKEPFVGKVLFLENYDMNISRHLISGVDVWLNNPRRPFEASGTSGQKVPLNGGINFSVLDGWWSEGHDGDNGWSIGEERDFSCESAQDDEDSKSLYSCLEESIAPLYYQGSQKHGFYSRDWLEKAKVSMATNLPRFSTYRMVQDYVDDLYIPALKYGEKISAGNGEVVKKYCSDRERLNRSWKNIAFTSVDMIGSEEVESNYGQEDNPSHHVEVEVDELIPGRVWTGATVKPSVEVYLGDLVPELVDVEVVITKTGTDVFEHRPLKFKGSSGSGLYSYADNISNSDVHRYRIRVVPRSHHLSSKFEMGLVYWL